MADVEKGEARAPPPAPGAATGVGAAQRPPPAGANQRPAVAFQVGDSKMLHALETANKVLGPDGVAPLDMVTSTLSGKDQIKTEERLVMPRGLIHPYNTFYRVWWWFIIGAAIVTGWLEPYQIAFLSPTPVPVSVMVVLQYLLLAVFLVDMVMSCFVGYYHKGRLVADRRSILLNYAGFRLWWDLLTTLPWDWIVLAGRGLMGSQGPTARYIALLGLLKLGRMYRVGRLFRHMEYAMALPLVATLLARNIAYMLFVVHWAGCAIFYIARQEEVSSVDENDSWVARAAVSGQLHMSLDEVRAGGWDGRTTFHLYIYSIYFSLVTLAGLGGGDLNPWAIAEVAWAVVYLAFNVLFLAYITGSITLCVFRVHEAWGVWRDKLHALEVYSRRNKLPRDIKATIQEHLRLQYTNRGTDDKAMLSSLPTTLRRRVLRHEYGEVLAACPLLRGVSPKFIDALLCAATIETFMPGVDLLADGDYANDLTMVVAGYAEVFAPKDGTDATDRGAFFDAARYGRTPEQVSRDIASGQEGSKRAGMGAMAGSDYILLGPSDVYGAFSFFTEVAHHELVRSLTVCRVLMVPRAAYRAVASDFGTSSRKVLENLQRMAEDLVQQEFRGGMASRLLRSSMAAAGGYTSLAYQNTSAEGAAGGGGGGGGASGGGGGAGPQQAGLAAALSMRQQQVVGTLQRVRALVRHHVAGANEARTGQFLSACSKGELDRVKLMLGQGFSPDALDYGNRSGLMLAAASGQAAVVDVLLAVNARTNTIDRSGNSALLEACKAGQDEIIEALLSRGAKLGLSPGATALELGACVTRSDAPYLERLLRCGADPAARDTDRDTALHIAAAEGNLAACKALVQAGAPLGAANRYGLTPLDEAQLAQAVPVVEYLAGIVGPEAAARARAKYVDHRTERFLRACSSGDAAEVAALLARDCPPDCADYDSRTGLMLAAAKGSSEVVGLLLGAGANPNARDNIGGCALQEAVKAGRRDITEQLLARGAELNLGAAELANVLCNLVNEKSADQLDLYLAAGADPDAGDYDKRTALHIAAAEGDLDMVKLLVGRGASPAVRDRWGNTPADEARRVGARAVAAFLAEAAKEAS